MALLLLSACVAPQPLLKTQKYHASEAPEEKASRALNGLQIKALQLMEDQQYQQSLLFLQRAVKIAPRDPRNWYYMAQNYWHLHNFKQCQAMIERAQAYSQFDDALQKANRTLLQQCNGR